MKHRIESFCRDTVCGKNTHSSKFPVHISTLLKSKTYFCFTKHLKTSHTPLEANTSSVSSSLWLAWISNGFPALQYCSNKVMGFEVVTNGCLLGETDGERDCSRNLNSYTLRKEQIAVRKSNKNNKIQAYKYIPLM